MIHGVFQHLHRYTTACATMLMLMFLAGCKFESKQNILADEPTIPIDNILGDLGGAYFSETSGIRSASVGLTADGNGELILYNSGKEDRKIVFQAVYAVPGTSGAFLVAEIKPSGGTDYYLFRPKSNGEVDFIAVNSTFKEFPDSRVLLYWANLWAHGIAQKFVFTIFDESSTFRPVSKDEFDAPINERVAAEEAVRQERLRLAEVERAARDAFARSLAPSKKDVVTAYNRIARRQVATMSALAGECERAGDNPISATACLMGGAGQIDHSSYSMEVVRADIRDCTSVTGNVPSAICEVKPQFRAGDNQNAMMRMVAGINNVSGYRFVRFERVNGVWHITRTYTSCTKTAEGLNCTWTE